MEEYNGYYQPHWLYKAYMVYKKQLNNLWNK